MIKTAVVGASGIVGNLLCTILAKHPKVELAAAVSKSMAGKKLEGANLHYSKLDINLLNSLDVVFLALPHGESKLLLKKLKCKVIDLSSDHRLTHTYGLPEINKDNIKMSMVVANPGCYATACILAIWPIKDIVSNVVFDCISGYSGAGKNAEKKFSYKGNIIAYSLTNHFHISEIEKNLKMNVSFTPHVIDLYNGIMCTVHAKLKKDVPIKKIIGKYKIYKGTSTKITSKIPCVKDVAGSPNCLIGGFEKDKNGGIVIISEIDNLLKGAATQAIENMNLMCGFKFNEGINEGINERVNQGINEGIQ